MGRVSRGVRGIRLRNDADGVVDLSVLGADGVERSRRCVEGPPTAKLAVDEAGNSFLVGGRARLALDITALAPDGGLRGVARLDGCASGDEPRRGNR